MAVFTFSGIPFPVSGTHIISFQTVGDDNAHREVGDLLDHGIQAELADRTGRPTRIVVANPDDSKALPVFELTKSGIRRMSAKKPGNIIP
jgi:hypothetical protein